MKSMKGITVKEAKEAVKYLKQLTPARPKMDDDLEMSLREAIFFMADDLIQKTKRGCTIKELAKGLSEKNIQIKPGTLNRYLNEYQDSRKGDEPVKEKPEKKSDGASLKANAKSDSPPQNHKPSHDRPAKEALVVSMNEYGKVDLEYMSGLCGASVEKIQDELTGLIYLNPETKAWEIADHYLTGDVKKKLSQAKKAAESDNYFSPNVTALEAVQSPDLDPVDIAVQLGSTWVPSRYVEQFCWSILGAFAVENMAYHPALGQWVVDFNDYEIDPTTNNLTWGTSRCNATDLIKSILQFKPIVVKDNVGKDERGNPIYKINDEETAAAVQKGEEIKQAFEDWIWKDQERREKLARIYNDLFNTHVPRKYDGSHLTLPGSAVNIKLRPHQKDAIWRTIQDGGLMADHVVGAGKTLVVVASIMESRRMGLMKKPMVVVPNHLLAQWQDAFYSLYPNAKVLVAGKDDFKKEKRQRLFAKVATGDWDAVVVAHSSFKKIGLPHSTMEKIINEQVDDLVDSIEQLKRANGERL